MYKSGLDLKKASIFPGINMGYVEILSTALLLYVIGGAALLVGTVVVYGIALLIYKLLARLGALVSHLLRYAAAHVDFSLREQHYPFR